MDELKEVLKTNIGCSDIGAILGVDPYRNAGDVYDRLVGGIEQDMTPQMARGHDMEDVIARKYARETGRIIVYPGMMFKDRELPFWVGHIDRRTIDADLNDGVLEAKAHNTHMLRKIKREGIQDGHWLQIQGYLSLSGWGRGTFCTIDYDTWGLIHFDIAPDTEAILMIRSKLKDFWDNHVQKGIRPKPLTAPVELDLPHIGRSVIIKLDDPEWFSAANDLQEARQLRVDAELIEDAAKAKIIDIMAKYQCEVAEGNDLRVYYREQSGRKTFDYRAFGKAHPELSSEMLKYFKVSNPFKAFKPYFLT